MRIVFFGTGEFSATVLKGLVDANHNIVGVVTQPDKVNGRNGKVTYSQIKQYCLTQNIPIFQFAKLNLEGEQSLKELDADLFITASYGQIIKQNILNIPRFGIYNVHGSLLPKYRGPAPIQWAIINGERTTGITIMKTELGVDCGEMYLKKEVSIEPHDTSTTLFEKMAVCGVECILEFLNNFEHYIKNGIPQEESKSTYYPMIKKEDCKLDFNDCAFNICNRIRGLENCYFMYKGARYKVLFAVPSENRGEVGEILACNSKNGLRIGVKDTSIEVVTIQPEGKQKMFAVNYMNSNKFTLGDIIENS